VSKSNDANAAQHFNLAAERPLPELHSPGGLEDLILNAMLVTSGEPTSGC
jgi:hypothetical protein